jgi:tetratricopeptide repeat protein 8
VYARGSDSVSGDTHLLLGAARLHDQMGAMDKGVALYKRVLGLDASSVEAIACLASHHFYGDQPEVALKYYRRLLQMGVANTELWCNLGLCCFYASQYDMALTCFDRALALADDANMADVWYNVGHVAVGMGDTGLAYQAFRVAVSVDPGHAESLTNLGVLEMRKGNVEAARANFAAAQKAGEHLFEPWYNGALLAHKVGEFQEAYAQVQRALAAFPDHSDSQDLLRTLKQQFVML